MGSLVVPVLPLGGSVDHNLLSMSDEQILKEIYSTHVHNHSDTKFDADSLFTLVDNILERSTHVVDNIIQVYICTYTHLILLICGQFYTLNLIHLILTLFKNIYTFDFWNFCHLLSLGSFLFFFLTLVTCLQGNQGSQDQIHNRTPPASFTSPLCTLKQISSEVNT